MTSIESILSKLSKLRDMIDTNGGNTKFYISLMDFCTGKMYSKFSSSNIDDVVQYLFDKSLTTSIMTIQKVGKNEVCIILRTEEKYETNITNIVVESIIKLSGRDVDSTFGAKIGDFNTANITI